MLLEREEQEVVEEFEKEFEKDKFGDDDTKEGGHCEAAVLDLHLHKAAVALRALRRAAKKREGRANSRRLSRR